MQKKLNRKIFICTVIILVVLIIVAIFVFNQKIKKEINIAKDFIQILYDNNMVSDDRDIEDIKFDISKQSDGVNDFYSITSKDFCVDLNEKERVIGFNYNRNNPLGDIIDAELARNIAEKYVSILVNGDYKFKEEDNQESDVTYYSYVFTKYKGGFPFYNDQIIIQVDKYSGYLTRYTNIESQNKPEKIEINVEKQDAGAIAIESFNELNNDGELQEEDIYTAFCDNEDKTKTELCYVVSVVGKDMSDKEVKMKVFVSTKSGEVINKIKDNVTTSAS